jgi:hypothetical protein
MLRYLSAVLLFALLLLNGCSLFREVEIPEEILLKDHLQGWQDFRIEGIVELTHGQLRLRKNVSINKTPQYLELTVFDSGIFGLRPSPFLSVRIDSTLTMDLPIIPGTEVNADSLLVTSFNIEDINTFLNEMKDNSRDILRERKYVKGKTEFLFNDNMQISLIRTINEEGEESSGNLRLVYDRDNLLERITLSQNDKSLIIVHVDRVTYRSIKHNR